MRREKTGEVANESRQHRYVDRNTLCYVSLLALPVESEAAIFLCPIILRFLGTGKLMGFVG